MKCLVLGGTGKLGSALAATAPARVRIFAPPRAVCDLTDPAQLQDWLGKLRPDLVINAAGYTDVDAAESHEEEARQVNAQGAGLLATLCTRQKSRLLHVSTDFVFDGEARAPYVETDRPAPVNAYGRGKYEGEILVRRENPDAMIVRTAWLYAEQGRNFVSTMLALMCARDEIGVVEDQVGTPTHAANLARALWQLADGAEPGLYHFTDEGEASRYEFAVAIRDEAHALGFLTRKPQIIPLASHDYPTPARRPFYSVLDNGKIRAKIGTGQYWRDALSGMLSGRRNDG